MPGNKRSQTIFVDLGGAVIVGGAAAWTHKECLLIISLEIVGGCIIKTS